jgi:NitT/TauT family transport system substrate-binding protein
MPVMQTRRRFLTMTALTGAAGILSPGRARAAEPALETTTVRLGKMPVICFAPQYVCEMLLRAEGFTDIRYVDTTVPTQAEELGAGKIHFHSNLAHEHVIAIDRGLPITVVAGIHAGCYELFAHGGIRGIADLKGKRVGGDSRWLSLIAAYVGLDPNKDLALVDVFGPKGVDLFAEGKLDAYMAFPPEVQDLHVRKVGHVILRTAADPPWSQYFCCMMAANGEYAERYPVATKRVIRAVLKAADLCAREPEAAARLMVEGGFTERYEYVLQALTENPYAVWREYDAEDTIRFYALRLHELGIIKSTPNQIIATGTDWRFLNGIKRELKA